MAWIEVATVESDSEPGRTYKIRRAGTGRLGCDCKAYQFSRGEKTCKHLRALSAAPLPALAVLETVPAETVRVKAGGETFTVRRAICFGEVPR